jgi:hypothetical protein
VAEMKILVLGRAIPSQPDRCTGQQLTYGFIETGHDCVFYGNYYGSYTSFLGYKELQSYRAFDLVIETEMNDGEPKFTQLRQYFKLQNIPWLLWDFDVSYQPERNIAYAGSQTFAGYLVGNKNYVHKFADKFKKPTLHLPYACSPIIHRKMPDVKKEFLIGFVGSLTEERKKTLEVMRGFANIGTEVFAGEGIFGDALIKATNRLRVMFHQNQQACAGLVPGRPWETTGCGTTLLMDRLSYNDFVDFLPQELHNNLYAFDDEKAIMRWFTEFQDKPIELEMNGEALQKFMHQNHSYKNRAESIITFLKENKVL